MSLDDCGAVFGARRVAVRAVACGVLGGGRGVIGRLPALLLSAVVVLSAATMGCARGKIHNNEARSFGDGTPEPLEILSGPTAYDITQTSAIITWTLNRGATGQIEYGLDASYGSQSVKEESVDYTTHTQTLQNLTPATTYHYRVVSECDGSTATSLDQTFTTQPLQLMALVRDAEAVGDIVCPSDVGCGPAAQDLQRLIRITSGVTVPITTAKQSGRNSLKITTPQAEGLTEIVEHDGFRIDSDAEDEIVLYAHQDENGSSYGGNRGMEMGVAYLVARDLGVVWLYPGDGFEVVPRYTTVQFNRATTIQNPKFQFRRIYLSTTQNTASFLLHNKNYDRGDRFGHDMNLTYPVSKYGTTHPEFYPILDGVRYIPIDDNDKIYWNPVVDAPGATEAAIETISDYITATDTLYYSLAVNDHGNTFDDKWDTNPLNSRGLINMSNEYWLWVKEVAEGVHAVHPQVTFGTLAYNNVYDPPTNGTVLPEYVSVFITADLFSYSTPERRALLTAQIDAWHAVASTLGVWDYSMGEANGQVLPRIHNAKTKEYLAFLNRQGINTYFGEYDERLPHWLCGPKLVVDTQSLWSYEQSDVVAGQGRWARAAVGESAAQHAVAYFGFWESYWNDRLFDSPIMDRYRFHGGYYNGNNRGTINYLRAGEIAMLDTQITSMLAKVASPAQGAMAELICDSWSYVREEIYYLVESGQLGELSLIDFKDFESGVESSWGDGERDTTVGHDSGASMRLDLSVADVANGRAVKSRIFGQYNVTPGDYIEITGYVRGVGFVAEDDAVCFGVDSWKDGASLSSSKSHMFCAEDLLTGNWEQFSGVLRIPVELSSVDNGMYLQTQIIAVNAGQVWFDDISISRTSDPGVTPLDCQAPGFSCDSAHLGYCAGQAVCEEAGGIWCYDQCDSHRCSNFD